MSNGEDMQLDLLGGAVPAGEPSGEPRAPVVHWAKLGRTTKLGWVETNSPHEALADVDVLVVAVAEPAPWAALEGPAIRHLAPDGDREPHIDALAADARAGRRAVIVSDEAGRAAELVAATIVALGRDGAAAIAAAGGRGALRPRRAKKVLAPTILRHFGGKGASKLRHAANALDRPRENDNLRADA